MAFIVKNSSSFFGSAKIGDKWETLAPGESVKVKDAPIAYSHNIQVSQLFTEEKESKGGDRPVGDSSASVPDGGKK